MASIPMQFRLFLLFSVIVKIAAQCSGFEYSFTTGPNPSSELTLSWTCGQANNEFQATYRLTNRDQCDTGDNNEVGLFNDTTTLWVMATSVTLRNLIPHSTYEVTSVKSRLLQPGGGYSYKTTPFPESATTGEAVPIASPAIVVVYGLYETYIEFEWDDIPCGSRHGDITYEYRVTDQDGQPASGVGFQPMSFTEGRTGVRVTGVKCGDMYLFSVAGKTSAGRGPYSGNVAATPKIAPGSVRQLSVVDVTARRMTVQWMEPENKGCPVIDTYVVKVSGQNLLTAMECQSIPLQDAEQTTKMLSLELDVLPFYEYTISVKAEGGSSVDATPVHSLQSAPSSQPENVHLTGSSESTLGFTWDELPCMHRNGDIIDYTYQLSAVADNSLLIENNVTMTSITIPNLTPGTQYLFSVAARTMAGTGNFSSLVVQTAGSTSTVISTTSKNTPFSTHSSDRSSTDSSNNNVGFTTESHHPSTGSINGLPDGSTTLARQTQVTTKTTISSMRTDKALTTTPSSNKDSSTRLTDMIIKTSKITSSTITNEGTSAGNKTDSPVTVIAGVVGAVVIIVIVIVIFFLFKRREKEHHNESHELTGKSKPINLESGSEDNRGIQNGNHLYPDLADDQEHETPTPPQNTEEEMPEQVEPKTAPKPNSTQKLKKVKPIKVENLPGYIAKQKARRSEGFKSEFSGITFGQEYPWDVSQNENNKAKNRYLNIATYDHSRVVLHELEGVPDSDYINASYVKGYKDKLYIASQGPCIEAMGEIWRMAWEKNSTKIVMLTNLVERGKRKCEQYWPDPNESATYTPMVVKHKQTQEYADFIIRDFILEKNGQKEPREIRQFHFISWPDMGVPKYPTPLINFLRLVNAYQPEETGLPIIHCSAGVGRTGTFIVMDAMLEMADEEGAIDINGAVRKLRKDRMNMVQTNAQYEFIYEAVQEALLCGDTSIHVTNLRQGFNEIQNSVNKSTGNTKLKDQFQILDSLTAPPEQERSAGYAPENVNKNRFPDRVPSDGVRPRLNDDESSVNYINAAFLDGYVRKREYIVTQMPLPHTVEDFWRMVYKYKSTSIVMLNGMESSDSNFGVYWIKSGTLPLVNLTVEFKSSKQYMDEVIGRTFKVYANDKPQDYLTVQQFQFLAWPVGRETPDSPAPLIAMVKIIDKWQQKQQKSGKARPMTVHCIDGVGVSGVFCALVSMLNRMKLEKVVDVFQSVKRLRMGRPGMVETMEQYQFLFKAAQVSLEEFKIYENFR